MSSKPDGPGGSHHEDYPEGPGASPKGQGRAKRRTAPSSPASPSDASSSHLLPVNSPSPESKRSLCERPGASVVSVATIEDQWMALEDFEGVGPRYFLSFHVRLNAIHIFFLLRGTLET